MEANDNNKQNEAEKTSRQIFSRRLFEEDSYSLLPRILSYNFIASVSSLQNNTGYGYKRRKKSSSFFSIDDVPFYLQNDKPYSLLLNLSDDIRVVFEFAKANFEKNKVTKVESIRFYRDFTIKHLKHV